MPIERLANYGSALMKKEATKGVPVIPDVTLPFMGDTMTTDPHTNELKLIVGHGLARHKNIMGQKTHMGEITVEAEPNTAARLADMLLTRTATSGSNPYTHTFAKSAATNPNSYTLQIQKGQVPYRYFGVEARSLALSFQDNVGQFAVALTARGVFSAAEITNVATNTLSLNAAYGDPTAGLVVGDLVAIYDVSADAMINTTVSSISPGVSVTVGAAGAAAIGDILVLRALTPSLSLLDPVTWTASEYRFGADATTALSATHTPIESGSGEWTISHNLKTEGGEGRSGSYNPATLARTVADVELSTQQTFDLPTSERNLLLMKKQAIVVRHFVGSYEIRLTLNDCRPTGKPNPLTIDDVIYDTFTWRPGYDDSDAAAWGLTVINTIPTI